jgi:hypothetical protein
MAGSAENGLDARSALIAGAEIHQASQVALISSLHGRGESTREAMRVLREIKNTLGALRAGPAPFA